MMIKYPDNKILGKIKKGTATVKDYAKILKEKIR
jgi:hypothetical protein